MNPFDGCVVIVLVRKIACEVVVVAGCDLLPMAVMDQL